MKKKKEGKEMYEKNGKEDNFPAMDDCQEGSQQHHHQHPSQNILEWVFLLTRCKDGFYKQITRDNWEQINMALPVPAFLIIYGPDNVIKISNVAKSKTVEEIRERVSDFTTRLRIPCYCDVSINAFVQWSFHHCRGIHTLLFGNLRNRLQFSFFSSDPGSIFATSPRPKLTQNCLVDRVPIWLKKSSESLSICIR